MSGAAGWCLRGGSDDTGRMKVYTGQKITLDFRDAEIVNVLRILSEIGGENIVITDDVKGRITLRLVDVPWDQAFDVVLQTNGLDCLEMGSAWRVSSLSGPKRERDVGLAAEALGRSDVGFVIRRAAARRW